MRTIEFMLERVVQTPIDKVFARLIDIEGHNEWMPKKGTVFKHVRQISPGEPRVGTTYLEETAQGPQPGEIVELEAPHKVTSLVGDVEGRQVHVRRLAKLFP